MLIYFTFYAYRLSSPLHQLLYVLLIRIAEENAVSVTINNPNPNLFAFVNGSVNGCPAKGSSSICHRQAVEWEYCCAHDAITGIENDLDSLAYHIVQLALFWGKCLVL